MRRKHGAARRVTKSTSPGDTQRDPHRGPATTATGFDPASPSPTASASTACASAARRATAGSRLASSPGGRHHDQRHLPDALPETLRPRDAGSRSVRHGIGHRAARLIRSAPSLQGANTNLPATRPASMFRDRFVDARERADLANDLRLAGGVQLEHLAQVGTRPDDRARDRDPVQHGLEDWEARWRCRPGAQRPPASRRGGALRRLARNASRDTASAIVWSAPPSVLIASIGSSRMALTVSSAPSSSASSSFSSSRSTATRARRRSWRIGSRDVRARRPRTRPRDPRIECRRP